VDDVVWLVGVLVIDLFGEFELFGLLVLL